MGVLEIVVLCLAAVVVVAMAVGKVAGRDGILALVVLAVLWLLAR